MKQLTYTRKMLRLIAKNISYLHIPTSCRTIYQQIKFDEDYEHFLKCVEIYEKETGKRI